MDLKLEIIPSFVQHTFLLIYLSQDSNTFSMFCPPRYLNIFHEFEIWNHSKFCPPHFSFDIPSSGCLYFFSWIWNLKIFQVLSSKLFYWYTYLRTVIHFLCSVLHDTWTLFMDLKFENIPSFVLDTFLVIYLSQDSNKFSMFCPPRYEKVNLVRPQRFRQIFGL